MLKSHTKIQKQLGYHKKLVFNEEVELLNNIQNAIDTYMSRAYNNDYSTEIQNLDTSAFKSLEGLSKNIYGANSNNWEDLYEQKIKIYEDIKRKIVKDTRIC